jgi:hypothetical protein
MTRDGADVRPAVPFAVPAPALDLAARRSFVGGRLSLSWLSPIAGLAALASVIGPLLRTPLSFDVAWVLFFSRRWLEGAWPYVDILDYKPPLIFLLGMPIETMSRATGWPEASVVALACIACAAISIALVHAVLSRTRTAREGMVATTVGVGVLAMLATPARDLGQVDHVMLIAILPYVVLCALTSVGDVALPRALRIGIGLLAALGLALKPPFLIAWIVLLAFVAISRRRPRALAAPEHAVIAVSLLAYAIVVATVVPQYLRQVIPMAYEQWWRHGDPLLDQTGDWMVLAITISSLALALTAHWLTRDREWSSLVRAAASASLGLYVTFLAQRQAVPDHFLGVRAFNLLAVALAVAGFVAGHVRAKTQGRGTASLGPGLGLAARTVVVALAIMPLVAVETMIGEAHDLDAKYLADGIRSPYAEPLIDVVRAHAAGKPIFVLSSSVAPAFPLVNLSGATWPYRFNSVGFVSSYYRNRDEPVAAAYRPPAQQSAQERAFFDAIVADLTRTPPTLLIVDRTWLKQGFGWVNFDYLDYYRQSPAFAALLRHYRPIAQKGNYQVIEYHSDPLEAR